MVTVKYAQKVISSGVDDATVAVQRFAVFLRLGEVAGPAFGLVVVGGPLGFVGGVGFAPAVEGFEAAEGVYFGVLAHHVINGHQALYQFRNAELFPVGDDGFSGLVLTNGFAELLVKGSDFGFFLTFGAFVGRVATQHGPGSGIHAG